MLTKLGAVFTQMIKWVGEFVTALTGETGDLNGLQDLLVIGIAISLVMVAVKIVRKVAWGA